MSLLFSHLRTNIKPVHYGDPHRYTIWDGPRVVCMGYQLPAAVTKSHKCNVLPQPHVASFAAVLMFPPTVALPSLSYKNARDCAKVTQDDLPSSRSLTSGTSADSLCHVRWHIHRGPQKPSNPGIRIWTAWGE